MKRFVFLFLFLLLYILNSPITGGELNYDINKQIVLYQQYKIEKIVNIIEHESEIDVSDSIAPRYIEYMYNTAIELKIPIRLVFRLIFKESSFEYKTNLSSGAEGFMQVMPATRDLYVKRYNIDTIHTDKKIINIFVGMHLLRDLYDYWDDVDKVNNSEKYIWSMALASYNAGIAFVMKYNCVPPVIETIELVDFVLKDRKNGEQINKIDYYKKLNIDIYENKIEINT
jgi:hypothetical protein